MKTTTVALGSHFDEFIQASGYVEDFDFEAHLAELNAGRKD